MKRKLLVVISLSFLVTSIVSASGLHGEFEGNPVVSIQSGGKELKVEDVPAINYRDRTMVPIYLLRQLGADVTWNSDTYSVNVSLPSQTDSISEDATIKERVLLKNTYQILSDLDMSMWMFVVKLQYYANIDNPSEYLPLLNTEYENLFKQYNDSTQLALKVFQTVESNPIDTIIKSEASAMNELIQCKDMLIILMNNKEKSEIGSIFKIKTLRCLQTIQQSIDNTKKIHHDMLLQEIDKSLK